MNPVLPILILSIFILLGIFYNYFFQPIPKCPKCNNVIGLMHVSQGCPKDKNGGRS